MKNALAILGLLLATNAHATSAPDSRQFRTVKEAVQAVSADCGELKTPGQDFNYFPPQTQLSLKQCQSAGAKLCWMGDNAMGGRWSRQLICHRGETLLGGLRGSYEQGRIQRPDEEN